jgi:hypothetical protein
VRGIIVLVALALAASTITSVDAAGSSATTAGPAWVGGIIGSLDEITTIGSTVDPLNGDQNPYGLTIAPAGSANGHGVQKGDLVVCNFNDRNPFNIQGLGTSIVLLSPVPGSMPRHLVASPYLTGCAALAMGGALPWAAALDANDNPIVSADGTAINPLNTFGWTGPWGQVFVPAPVSAPKTPSAFYESNANDGSIVRINLGKPFTFDTIATGLPVNHGVPGSILAPSGLTYDRQRDVLYVVDGAVNALIAIWGPATIRAGGIVVQNGTIGGPQKERMKIIARGGWLNNPISAALLFNGDIVVGNTANNNLLEFTPDGHFVGARPLDKGNAGALFGIVASGTSAATTRIYFNDDNDNTVKVLTR